MDRKGRLFMMADKAADLTLLGMVWLLTSIPVLTVGTSCSALYYAAVKSVRLGEERLLRAYFRAWRENVMQGCMATGIFLLTAGLLVVDGRIMRGTAAYGIVLLLMLLLTATAVFFFPVLSRFHLSLGQCFRVSFVMVIGHMASTCMLLGTLLLCGLVFLLYPFLLPALAAFYAFYASFVLEKVFRTYIDP